MRSTIEIRFSFSDTTDADIEKIVNLIRTVQGGIQSDTQSMPVEIINDSTNPYLNTASVPAPTPAPTPAPVVTPTSTDTTEPRLKQGAKTATILNFVTQSGAEGVTPKQILKYLRSTFEWARVATSLANTVHTSLNNLGRRGILVYDESTRTYKSTAHTTSTSPISQVTLEEPVDLTDVTDDSSTTPDEEALAEAAPVDPIATLSEEELEARAAHLKATQTKVPDLFTL